MHAHARVVFVNSRDLVRLLIKLVVRRRRCTASLADPNLELRTDFWVVLEEKVGEPCCVCHPDHSQLGLTRLRVCYKRF